MDFFRPHVLKKRFIRSINTNGLLSANSTLPILVLHMQVEIEGEVESVYGLEDLLNNPYNFDGLEVEEPLEFKDGD
uniref:Uncharacterized protein n=1 Tax=Cucumis melo TaxID=3656 RepID=A0A9I9EJW2_CUCME